jgi:hypothetical protein
VNSRHDAEDLTIHRSRPPTPRLMMRTWAGWYAAALHAHHQQGRARPLLVVLDCEGGLDVRVKAGRTRTLLHAAGASQVAIWPDEAAVSL